MKTNNTIKCKVKVQKVFFPKGKRNVAGEWASFSCEIISVISGEPKLSKYSTINCAGKNVPSFEKEEIYTIVANGKLDKKWGWQYEIISMSTEYNLDDPRNQKLFLSFILTEQQIHSLYSSLENPFDAIKKGDAEKLTSVKGIGAKKACSIIQKYEQNEMNSKGYVELAEYGLTKEAIDKLINLFGVDKAVEIVREDPYQLIGLARGYGWKKTDSMALSAGMPKNDVRRVAGFIKYFMLEKEQDGNSFVSPDELFDAISEQIELAEPEKFKHAMHKLYEDKFIWWDDTKKKIYLLHTVNLEKQISQELLRLQKAECLIEYNNVDDVIKEIEKKNNWEFTDEQVKAVQNTLKSNVSIITGSAGTGKTSVVSAIVQSCNNVYYAQTALAGRAAARMSEVTGEDGSTIHRLLGMKDGKFLHNKTNQLPYDLIVLDEVSMLGGSIFYSLVSAIKDGAKLIMLGDIGQLESIGTLNLFRDMLDSKNITVSQLNKIHRQAAKSAIVTTSVSIRNQNQIFKSNYTGSEIRGELQDLELDIYDESALSQRKIVKHFKRLISEGIDPNDIQVIVPMKTRGDISTFELNQILESIANPEPNPTLIRTRLVNGQPKTYSLKIGDKVINMSNNYKTITPNGENIPIFNGNLGIIKELEEDSLVIDFFQWGEVIVSGASIDSIEPAYAITCHKLQGSQSPYTIIGVDNSAYMMLSKEWLYTAVTRAQEYCVLCGQNEAVRKAIETSKIPYKQTMLKIFLDEEYDMSSIPPSNSYFNLSDND